MDITQYLLPWSNILLVANFSLTLGVLALFIDAAIILRTLVLMRQALVYYALLLLPLGASILFFFLTLVGWQVYAGFSMYEGSIMGRYNPALRNMLQATCIHAAINSLLELVLLVVVFILTLLLEKKLLPRMSQRPLWTVVRRQRVV